jgi:hypothetical protein
LSHAFRRASGESKNQRYIPALVKATVQKLEFTVKFIHIGVRWPVKVTKLQEIDTETGKCGMVTVLSLSESIGRPSEDSVSASIS